MEIGMSTFGLIAAAVYAVGTIFWLWMIVDCAMKEKCDEVDKMVMIMCILMSHMLGALVYLLFRRPRRIAQYGS